jgi:hypothetical protein
VENLKQIFLEICKGCSYLGELDFYFKHPNLEIEVEMDEIYHKALVVGRGNGLESSEELLKKCMQNGSWSNDREKSIKNLESEYRKMDKTRANPISEAQLYSLRQELKNIAENYSRILSEKDSLLEDSIEFFAKKRTVDALILNSFFKDRELKLRAFSQDDLDYLEDSMMFKLVHSYNGLKDKFCRDNIRKICIEPFFMKRFAVSEDKFDFFGLPCCSLTDYQISLISEGEKFKFLLGQLDDIPDEYNDPEGIEDLCALKNAKVLKTKEQLAKEDSVWNF